MESRAKLFGHHIHQTLVEFAVGLLATSVAFDLVAYFTGSPGLGTVGWWMLVVGVIAGAVVVPFGMIDLMTLPPHTRALRVGRWHGAGNAVVLALFVGAWAARRDMPEHAPTTLSLLLSVAAGGLAALTAWLGGELVSRLGVGVSDGAQSSASNSITAGSHGAAVAGRD